jgi:hypothetical protein
MFREAEHITLAKLEHHFAAGETSLAQSANITATVGSCALRAQGDGAQHFRPCESIDSVQKSEAELRIFEARWRELKLAH